MAVRTKVSDVSQVLSRMISNETQQAAGANTVLSRAEQAAADPMIAEAAKAVREASAPGARVTTRELDQKLMSDALELIGSVNQTSGSGAQYLSRQEANEAHRKNPLVGLRVLAAYEVASGGGTQADDIARDRVSSKVTDETQTFKQFQSESEAENYQDPDGKSVYWLVKSSSDLMKATYVWGINDLWAERFEVNKLDGKVTTLAEH